MGIVQTTIDARKAWQSGVSAPVMSAAQDEHAWREICNAMKAFQDDGSSPKLIVLPELSLPRTRLADFERLVAALNVIAVTGIDYTLDRPSRVARNEGIVLCRRDSANSDPRASVRE